MKAPPVPGYISAIQPYVPGKPVEEVERELNLTGSVKLASNENPFGPSPKAVRAIQEEARRIHRYPDGSGYYLRQRLARAHALPPECIILGNGSSEIVELLARTFLGHDGSALMADQAFIMYRLAVTAVNGNARLVPLREMTHDLRAMAEAVEPRDRLIYIANPNNPTGTCVGPEELEGLFASIPPEVIVVLDEAYREYAEGPGYPDGLDYLRAGRNVAVLRTFSKIHGLAGIRVGYALTTPEIAASVEKIRQPFNTSSLAQVAALAALDDADHVRRSRESTREERRFLESRLQEMGLDFTPSVANFVLVHAPAGAQEVFQALLRRGVIVRPMTAYNFPRSLRVTIGTRAENLRFLEAYGQVLEEGTGARKERG